jgi:hypothetical protein
MQPDGDPYQEQRSACLPWMLGLFIIGFFGLLLSVATGGYFVYVAGVVVAVMGITAMHYALWGRMLDESVAAEREEEEARELDEVDFPRLGPTSDRFRRKEE